MSAEFDPAKMIRVLESHGVEFVVIGGLAAAIQGAPLVTADLDIVYATGPANLVRLVSALRELRAVYRHQFGRRLEPTVEGLGSTQGGGHHLFETSSGDLDVLRTAAGRTFEDLRPHAVRVDMKSANALILELEKVIELKTAADRPPQTHNSRTWSRGSSSE
ncbi:MAG: hypothetical protein HY791_05280 [Deltaproteobacteria bacterium]|nr:hypothetical protein [Deltaproteobacteria bacterium]